LIQVTDSWYCIRCGNCCLVDFEDKWLDYIGVVGDEESSSGKCSNSRFEKNKFSCAILYTHEEQTLAELFRFL
jgi:hypothetical protein